MLSLLSLVSSFGALPCEAVEEKLVPAAAPMGGCRRQKHSGARGARRLRATRERRGVENRAEILVARQGREPAHEVQGACRTVRVVVDRPETEARAFAKSTEEWTIPRGGEPLLKIEELLADLALFEL